MSAGGGGRALSSKVGGNAGATGASTPFSRLARRPTAANAVFLPISLPATPTASSNGLGLTEDRLRLARLPAPIYASLIDGEDGEGHNLIWSRRNGD